MNAIMTQSHFERPDPQRSQRWEGLSEIDQAISENRLTEYRIRKSWADPLARKLTIVGMLVILAVFSFLVGASFGLW
ncbi:hypothetical protein [Sphingomonas sp.]|uniref:hypothetical protein n=1 Tax=Sphingomonas sp. TaxID=28214 RepID=UPI003F72478A